MATIICSGTIPTCLLTAGKYISIKRIDFQTMISIITEGEKTLCVHNFGQEAHEIVFLHELKND